MSNLKSAYKILPNHNLIIEFHTGELNEGSYISFKKKLFENPLFSPRLHHFIHFKNVIFNTSSDNISTFIDFINKNIEPFNNRKVAIVTDTPNQVVSTTMYKLMQNRYKESVEIFSTDKIALESLHIKGFTFTELTEVLNELNTKVTS